MSESSITVKNSYISPQCQHFVSRKKRLCRMTVKPGKHYCGEHEPLPKTDDGEDDTRIPCPNDPKHTCYASKLEKHLSICNARQQQQPDYILHNVNAPAQTDDCPRLPLAELPLQRILQVIDKVNGLYDKYLQDNITAVPEQPIHSAVLQEFSEEGRTERSRRHLRQASSLLRLLEAERLVADHTAYVELGAGKGQLSYYAWRAWCRGAASHVLLVDRASLRHKRDNRLRGEPHGARAHRLRADLAHLLLERVPAVRECGAVVGYAKHLCGVATDLALRCVSAPGVAARVRGVVLASCCHHRCERAAYPAAALLQKLGIDADDFNTILGIVSWATCGDGRSRDLRNKHKHASALDAENPDRSDRSHDTDNIDSLDTNETHETDNPVEGNTKSLRDDNPDQENIDLYNEIDTPNRGNTESHVHGNSEPDCGNPDHKNSKLHINDNPNELHAIDNPNRDHSGIHVEPAHVEANDANQKQDGSTKEMITEAPNDESNVDFGTKNLKLSQEQREAVGRRAKALLDWGRVLFLRERGFDARLVHYVPQTVSLENVCIVATKRT